MVTLTCSAAPPLSVCGRWLDFFFGNKLLLHNPSLIEKLCFFWKWFAFPHCCRFWPAIFFLLFEFVSHLVFSSSAILLCCAVRCFPYPHYCFIIVLYHIYLYYYYIYLQNFTCTSIYILICYNYLLFFHCKSLCRAVYPPPPSIGLFSHAVAMVENTREETSERQKSPTCCESWPNCQSPGAHCKAQSNIKRLHTQTHTAHLLHSRFSEWNIFIR